MNTPDYSKHIDSLLGGLITFLFSMLTRIGDRRKEYRVIYRYSEDEAWSIDDKWGEVEFYGLKKKEITTELVRDREKIASNYIIEIRAIEILKK